MNDKYLDSYYVQGTVIVRLKPLYTVSYLLKEASSS